MLAYSRLRWIEVCDYIQAHKELCIRRISILESRKN